MRIIKLARGLYQIKAEKKELGMAFLRLQEYYESVKFKGKIFSVEEFKAYWKKTKLGRKSGKFSYCQYFDGFNIPSKVLRPFYDGKFNPLTKLEKQILMQLKKIKEKKFYIIGTRNNGSQELFKHELAHSLFHSNHSYKMRVKRVLKKLDKKSKMKLDRYLKDIDYHPAVMEDERHAYLLAGKDDLKDARISIPKIQPVAVELDRIFSSTIKMLI